MRNIFVFFGALLIVDGVFGDDVTLSVMEGDSVTLNPHTVIPEDDPAEWFFDEERIARMNKAAGIFSTSDGDDGRFKGKLELDHQTGSLTITNIRTNHAGLYKLQIRIRDATSDQTFKVTVSSDVLESVSVVEGDTVTLHTGVTDIQRDEIQWKFGDPGVLNADLNGDLTIRNIRRNQSGDYELEINTSSMILHRKLHINISDTMTTVSVKEGEPSILSTGLIEIKRHDLILWKFEDHLIAEINKGTNQFLTHDTSEEKFKGRLQLSETSGSLTIRDSRSTDTGVYYLNMNSSSHTVQRAISVTVSDPGVSAGVIAGIVVAVLLVFAAAVAGLIYYRRKNSKLQRRRDDAEKNGTNVSLKPETANSDD